MGYAQLLRIERVKEIARSVLHMTIIISLSFQPYTASQILISHSASPSTIQSLYLIILSSYIYVSIFYFQIKFIQSSSHCHNSEPQGHLKIVENWVRPIIYNHHWHLLWDWFLHVCYICSYPMHVQYLYNVIEFARNKDNQ